MLPRAEDLRFLIKLLREEMQRQEGTDFGYAKNPNIFRLQAWSSIALEAVTPREVSIEEAIERG